jgi:hypothetical protein
LSSSDPTSCPRSPPRSAAPSATCAGSPRAANLNYWAFWTGELDQQATDEFIGSTPVSSWHGDRLARHLAGRLYGNIGFTELNIHSLWALIRARPALADPVASDLDTAIMRLLDDNQVSAPARRNWSHCGTESRSRDGTERRLMSGETHDTTGFLYEIGLLKRYPRTGWALAGVPAAESVAEHSFRACIIAATLAAAEDADPQRAAFLALWHDTQETRTTDLPHLTRRYVTTASN